MRKKKMTIREIIKSVADSATAAFYGALLTKELITCMECDEAECDSKCKAKIDRLVEKSSKRSK